MKSIVNFLFMMGFSILMFSCSTPCREWILLQNETCNPKYNSARLILEPDKSSCYLELELDRTCSGTRMYMNLNLFQAFPLDDNPCLTKAEMTIDEELITFYPTILTGGQRLLVPEEIANRIIETLIEGKILVLKLGRNQITVISAKFQENYEQFMALPIEI